MFAFVIVYNRDVKRLIHRIQLHLAVVLSACVYVVAFHDVHVEEFTCNICNSTQYCTGGDFFTCPDHSTSNNLADSVTDCVCHAGYNRSSPEVCAPGTAPYFYVDGIQRSCRSRSRTDVTGAGDVSWCVCEEGFYGPGGIVECQECDTGTFNEGLNATRCEFCAPGSSNEATRSSNQSDCRCGVGSGNEGNVGPPGGPCECDAGWEIFGECLEGMTEAECNADSEGQCSLCEAGSVKPTVGNYECTSCGEEGKYMPEVGGKVCLECGEHSTEHDAVRCRCDAGYTGDPNALAPNCTMCPADYFKEGPGQHACEPCEDNAWSPPGTSAQNQCLCNIGYEQSKFLECVACAAGKYKNFSNDDSEKGLCTACPANANSPNTSVLRDACVCNVGFEGQDGEVCTACAAGTFWQAISGGSECENCPAGKYQPNASATACESCYASADSPEASTSIDACECNAGYTYVEDIQGCSGCAAGKFQTAGGCQTCADGTFTAYPAQTECASCPATVSTHNTNYEDGVNHTHCVCARGYHCREGPACQNGDCIACPVDTYQPELGDDPTCKDCPVNSQSQNTSDESSDCKCNHGYQVTPGELPETCTACAPGTYSDQLHTGTCLSCADDFIAASAAQTACVRCHDNAGTYDDQREVCMCDPGHYLLEESCSPCPVDMYKDASGNQACTACPDHSASPEGSVDQAACWCLPGYGEVSSGVCEQCTQNFFKETTENVPCTRCGTDLFITTTGSRNRTDCVCAPGDTLVGGQCRNCTDNTFKKEYGNQTCSPCQANSEAQGEAIQYDDCKCRPGFAAEPLLEESPAAVGCTSNNGRFICFDHSANSPHWFASKHMWNTYDACSTTNYIAPCLYEADGLENSCSFPSAFHQLLSCPALIVNIWYGDSNSGHYRLVRVNTPSGQSDKITIQEAYVENNWNALQTPKEWRWEGVSTIWNMDPADFTPPGTCTECAAGKAKGTTENTDCTPCAVDTFAYTTGVDICPSCPARSSTHGRTGQALCECVLGHERRWGDSAACEACREGTFKTASDVANRNCSLCGACIGNHYVQTHSDICTSTQNVACSECGENSWTPAGNTEPKPCYCRAGYGVVNVTADIAVCTACEIGFSRAEEHNNNVPCQICTEGKFADETAQEQCQSHTPNCNATPGTYVLAEGNSVQDIQCENCTVCIAGHYANRTCSVAYRNNRADTDCAICEPGYYCNNQLRYECPANTQSVRGSDSVTDCVCKPGFYASEEGDCVLCEVDNFCVDAEQNPCPSHSITMYTGADHLLDCNCRHGFFRRNLTELSFACVECTVNDWCFNNSRFDCPDDRMYSVRKSGSVVNCTCMDGWYNSEFGLGAVCVACPVNAYCHAGHKYVCPNSTWTNNKTQQHLPRQCLCQPSLYNDDAVLDTAFPTCRLCPLNTYCPGDNSPHGCPEHSVTTEKGQVSLQQCKCQAGFEPVHTGTAPLTHTCQSCRLQTDSLQNGTYKHEVGNSECQPCTQCWASTDYVYQRRVCSATQDALCDACDNCERDQSTVFTHYTRTQCTDIVNAQCEPCVPCNLSSHWENKPCAPHYIGNTQCTAINRTLHCDVGKYKGGHTPASQSLCLPCNQSRAQFARMAQGSQLLHTFTTHGTRYDDAFSCRVQCLGLSVLRDASDHSLGCRSCETGNVLRKNISIGLDSEGNHIDCLFTCRAGYTRNGTDCIVRPDSAAAGWSQPLFLEITALQKSELGFHFTVHHSSQALFIVVAGPRAPQGCSYKKCC